MPKDECNICFPSPPGTDEPEQMADVLGQTACSPQVSGGEDLQICSFVRNTAPTFSTKTVAWERLIT